MMQPIIHLRVFSLLLLLLHPLLISATITIAGTGERYPSHVDRLVGSRWMEGYEYMARLQHAPTLCPYSHYNPKNITLVPPSDGLPVVLLAPGDGCADRTKVQVAKEWIQPKGVVKYLIFYDTTAEPTFTQQQQQQPQRRRLGDDAIDATQGIQTHQEILHLGSVLKNIQQDADDIDRRDDYESRMGVLHVSHVTGIALLRILNTQSEQDASYGGPRVLLDGNNSSSAGAGMRNWLFWFGLALMCFGCLCSFCISVRLADDASSPPPPPARPERRRLTRLQVEEWFPPYCMPCSNDVDDSDSKLSLSQECAICLDDFMEGDYMRKLPCFHEFHSDCIGKWLVERHSTCPLCKLDLMPEEEEEEEEEEAPSIVDSADVDDQSSVEASNGNNDATEDNNRSFIMRLLTGQVWSRQRSDPQNVDQTPLLEQQQQDEYDDSTPLLDDQDDQGQV